MKALVVSDIEIGVLYSPQIIDRFKGTDLIISCGDLPYYYLEYILTMLNAPMFYVHGNHANRAEHSLIGSKKAPEGGLNIDQKVIEWDGILLAGIEGCLQYNFGPHQYTQTEMWMKVFALVPRLVLNKIRKGRYLDVFVTHAPAWGIHDQPDRPHQGIKAFTWLIKTFKPAYHVHGHIHVYRNDTETSTWVGKTMVVNSYGYKEIVISAGRSKSTPEMVHFA